MLVGVLAGAALSLGVVGAVAVGPGATLTFVSVVAGLAVVDFHEAGRRGGRATILPAALLVAVGCPVAMAMYGRSGVAAVTVAGFVVAMVTVLAGTRRDASRVLGDTLVAGALPGLGGAAAIGLSEGPDSLLVTLVAVVVCAEVAAAVARMWASTRPDGPGAYSGPGHETEVAAALLAVVVGTALAVLIASLPVAAAVGVGSFALLGLMGAMSVRDAVRAGRGDGVGAIWRATVSFGLAAPVVGLVSGGFT